MKLAPLVVSGVIVVVDQVEGEGERAGEWQSAARVRSPIGALGRPWRACEGAAGRRRRRGTRPWCVADAEAPRRARWEGLRWAGGLGREQLQCVGAL